MSTQPNVEQSDTTLHGAQTQDTTDDGVPVFCTYEDYCLVAGGSTGADEEASRIAEAEREAAERLAREEEERREREELESCRREQEAQAEKERKERADAKARRSSKSGPATPSSSALEAKPKERLNLRNFQIVDAFSGDEAPSVNVAEWVSKLEEMFRLLDIKPEQQLAYLKINLKGAAYSMVQNNVRVEDPVEAFTKARSLLLDRYGEDWLSVYGKLQKRRLEHGETVGEYLADIQRLWKAALPRPVAPEVTDMLTCVQMWHGLPDVPGLTAIRATWLDELDSKNPVESALSLCRSIRTESQFVAVADRDPSQASSGRNFGGRGKGSGKGRPGKGRKGGHNFGPATGPNCDIRKVRRCFSCGGTGHYKAECPSLRKVSEGTVPVSAFSTAPFEGVGGPACPCVVTLRANSGTEPAEPARVPSPTYTALIDSGCSTSIVSSRITCAFGKQLVRVRALHGDVELRVGSPIRINGVHVRPLVAPHRDVLTLSHVPIQAIVGLDVIRSLGGVHLSWAVDRWAVSFGALRSGIAASSSCALASHASKANPSPVSPSLSGKDDVVLEGADYVLRRVRTGPDTFRWVFRWKWLHGAPPAHGIDARPHYPGSVERLTVEQRQCFYEELDLWRKQGFIVPVPRHKLRNVLTCIPVCQMHKSTRVRPCLNYQRLNSWIVSKPNPAGSPDTAQSALRRWRRLPLAECCLVDISKAYMQVLADPDLALWQGVILPHLGPDASFVMSRLGFGVATAPRILKVVLDFIFHEEGLDSVADKFVDDIVAKREFIARLRAALLRNSFPTKEPTDLATSTLLGVTCTPAGRWTRREQLTDEVPTTRRELASVIGKLVAHYPIGGWLRVVAAMLTRVSTLFQEGSSYDYQLPPALLELYSKFRAYLTAVGDPVGGDWQINPNAVWTIHCDASATAMAAVLFMGTVRVEDRCWLRPKECRRHINVMECESVLRALSLVLDYRTAFRITAPLDVHVKTDNVSVVNWLTRKEGRHWIRVTGICKHAVESRLQLIEDICAANHLRLIVTHVASHANEADPITRIPQPLMAPFTKALRILEAPSGEVCAAGGTASSPPASDEREVRDWLATLPVRDGRVVVPPQDLPRVLRAVHDHEGSKALFEEVRVWIDCPGLAAACRAIVSACIGCQKGKAMPGDKFPLVPLRAIPRAPHVFDRLHLDICGPHRHADRLTRFYFISVVDSATGFRSWDRHSTHQRVRS